MRGSAVKNSRRKSAISRLENNIASYQKLLSSPISSEEIEKYKLKIERHLKTISNTELHMRKTYPIQYDNFTGLDKNVKS